MEKKILKLNKQKKDFDWKGAIISSFSVLVKSQKFKDLIESLIVKFLGLQISGGIRGWIIKTLLKHFRDEIVDAVVITVDYVEIRHETDETIDMDNRDDATTKLNNIMRK